MINIKVDESYAYDFLSILQIKTLKKIKNSQAIFKKCSLYIEKQIGSKLHEKILKSKQYKNLLKANLKTFEGVEKARYGLISAKQLDNYNMQRFFCKKELQKKFFNSDISEQKT